VRLSLRLVWFAFAVVVIFSPPFVVLGEHAPWGSLAWFGLLVVVLALYRLGRTRAAGSTMAVGMVLTMSVVRWFGGGASMSVLLYYPLLTVLGTFILGSRSGVALTAVGIASAGTLGLAGMVGLLEVQIDSRPEIAFAVVLATTVNAVAVALLSRPLRQAVQTALHAAERASEANRATRGFLDVVSVELRTPLHAILGYTETLLEQDVDDNVQTDLERILVAGRHLLGVVDDLIDMSTIASDDIDLHIADHDLASLLDHVTDVVQPLMSRRENQLTVDVAPGASTARVDDKRLRQILINLLSNAAKFTERGEVAVKVRQRGPDQLTITVSDSGIGMVDADLAQLFKPFRQVHHAAPGQYGGTGLGLAISRKLARKMGGDIEVTSRFGEGSTFVVTLCRAKSQAA
ncbi:MAG: HAMP domain-containing sensor histidine kinase, partial [Myxococcota bacterium]